MKVISYCTVCIVLCLISGALCDPTMTPTPINSSEPVGSDVITTSSGAPSSGSAAAAAYVSPLQSTLYREALAALTNKYNVFITDSFVSSLATFSGQPQLCSSVTGGVINSCKQGVRGQVDVCKKTIKDTIATCKDDVGRTIDQCKKKAKFYNKYQCELKRPGLMLQCESKRIDIPFCELDRLTAACCEGTRPIAKNLCYSGLSPAQIQKQVQSVQQKCAIVSSIAKVALKSYLSGQVVGLISEISAVKELSEGVKVFEKVKQAESDFKKYSNGLVAIAEGKVKDAEELLISLAPQLPSAAVNAIAWASAAESAINGKVDEFLSKATSAAGDATAILTIKKTVKELTPIANNIKEITNAAEECAKMKFELFPTNYKWPNIKSENEIQPAISKYLDVVDEEIRRMGKCKAVSKRIARVLSM